MCDQLVLEGLCKIKEFATNSNPAPNKTCGFQGSLAKIPVQPNANISKAFNPANLNLGTPQSTFAHGNNQLIQNQQIKQESIVNPPPSPSLSQDNFNNLGNPRSIGSPAGRGAKCTLAGHGRGSTLKKQRPATSEEIYSSLAEMKRECIRKVNAILKTCKPSNDPEGVIWNKVTKLNQGIVVGPKAPHSLMKDIAKLYPKLSHLTDEEKVTNLMQMMSQFVAENLTWMEVNYWYFSRNQRVTT